jgi:hypothetical protein
MCYKGWSFQGQPFFMDNYFGRFLFVSAGEKI